TTTTTTTTTITLLRPLTTLFRPLTTHLPRIRTMAPTVHQSTDAQSTDPHHPTIVFIGGGNMAEAIAGGLLANGYPNHRIRVSEPLPERIAYLHDRYPTLNVLADNHVALRGANPESSPAADVVVLAVKPQILRPVVTDIAPTLRAANPLVISIAAGIRTEDILRWAGAKDVALVRCMPNTPALVLEGAAGLYATAKVSEAQKETAERILGAVSKKVAWVHKEELLDAVTAVSGSGPAYFFLVMEAMAALDLGLSPDVAKDLTIQTCLGAAKMAQTSPDDLATLRRKVTSPKGTTEAAINTMEEGGVRRVIEAGVRAADARGKELADLFGKE
ncbi:pyrroline-5-carboxylate reductase, partial [Jimgerdemannia flammicorona]